MFSNSIENVRVAFIGLLTNKLRSALTMLGITIGVAAVIVLISIGQGVQRFVTNQFLGIGTNLVIVFGGENEDGESVRLTLDDAESLQDPFRVPDAAMVMPQLVLNNQPTRYEGREIAGRVRGVTVNFLEIRNRSIVAGRFFDQTEVDGLARVAIVGQTTLEKLMPDVYPIGQTIRINDVSFRIEGVLDIAGGSGFGGDEDDLIIIPITTAQTRLSGERVLTGNRPISNILVQARESDLVDDVAQQIRQTMREDRNIAFRAEDTFSIFTQTDLLSSLSNVTGLLTIFLGMIAGISLLVGGIGIMNIMLVTVTERTREIGLRKAVGAQKRDILLQFLTEATVLAMVGGGIGVLIAAAGTALLTAFIPDLAATVQLSSVLLATLISVAIGVFFGIYPASRAASLNPIDALRYE